MATYSRTYLALDIQKVDYPLDVLRSVEVLDSDGDDFIILST